MAEVTLVIDGVSYAMQPAAAPVPPPVVVQPPPPPPQTPTPAPVVSGIPLSWDAPQFASNTASNPVTVSGSVLSNKSFAVHGEPAAVVMGSNSTLRNVRIGKAVREGVRLGAGGNLTIEDCYLEATGSGDDHADTIQAYSPGSRGVLTIRRTAIVAHNTAATAGLFIADNWTGTIDLQDVVFNGGPFGCRIHPDVGGNNILRFKNVFFVGPFGWEPFLLTNVAGKINDIQLWENVRKATIVNGEIVPGNLIPKP